MAARSQHSRGFTGSASPRTWGCSLRPGADQGRRTSLCSARTRGAGLSSPTPNPNLGGRGMNLPSAINHRGGSEAGGRRRRSGGRHTSGSIRPRTCSKSVPHLFRVPPAPVLRPPHLLRLRPTRGLGRCWPWGPSRRTTSHTGRKAGRGQKGGPADCEPGPCRKLRPLS